MLFVCLPVFMVTKINEIKPGGRLEHSQRNALKFGAVQLL